jgi:tartrate-resistant acid phosphatase type 5
MIIREKIMSYCIFGYSRFRSKSFAHFAFLLIVLFIAAPVRAQDRREAASVRFLIVGDWGGSASKAQKAVAAAMAREAERIDAQFVVTAGDNYHGNGIASASDPRWKTEYEDVYSQKALQIPWYASLGNHDYAGNVDAEIEYSKISKRWKLPSRHYSQTEQVDDSTSILIIHIDTSPMKKKFRKAFPHYRSDELDPERQLRWLDSILVNSRSKWKIVVGHHPIYAAATMHGDSKRLKRLLLPILKKHRVPLYICGHDHVLQHLKHGNMNFIICGTGAKQWYVSSREDVVFGSRSLGFLSVIVTERNLLVNMVDEKNKILHSINLLSPDSE